MNNACSVSNSGNKIEISIIEQQDNVVLSVMDEGIGIPENELTTIFDPFTISSKLDEGSGGRGLGLSISRMIVSGHKGKISLKTWF